jgi:hypothetical protein
VPVLLLSLPSLSLLLRLPLLLAAPHQPFPILSHRLKLLLRPLNQLLCVTTTGISLTSYLLLPAHPLRGLDILDEPLLLFPAERVPLGDYLISELLHSHPRVLRFELLAPKTRIDRLQLGVKELGPNSLQVS